MQLIQSLYATAAAPAVHLLLSVSSFEEVPLLSHLSALRDSCGLKLTVFVTGDYPGTAASFPVIPSRITTAHLRAVLPAVLIAVCFAVRLRLK